MELLYLFTYYHKCTYALQTKLATTRNKNEQQDAKNNDDCVQTKWTKTPWKTFEETIRRGRSRSSKALLVTDNGDNDDDDDDDICLHVQ